MLVSFDEEDSVQDLLMRVAKQVGLSENQFSLVFQSKTLKAVHNLVEVVTIPGEWDCSHAWCKKRFGCFKCASKKGGTGYIASVQNHAPQ